MIRTLILFFLLTLSSYAANILSYNIYNRTDRVDLMITFDIPYQGKIVKQETASKLILKLYDAKIESSKIKQINSPFLSSISIIPINNYTQIVADIPSKEITLKVAKTTDKYGLRLRFVKRKVLSYKKTPTENSLKNLPTKQDTDLSSSYYIVVTLLIISIIILLVIKRKIANTSDQPQQNSWLFKQLPQKTSKNATKPLEDSNEVKIRFQKKLDQNNSVIMLDFQNQSYLMVLGQNNNLLLDKFIQNKPITQSEFEEILQERHTQLDQFLQIENQQTENTQPTSQKDDLLKNFSQKASHIP